MYKFIFEIITDPLGLPISLIGEYIILLILNEIAFCIAWKASHGGICGSEIHWAVRIPTFIVLWAIIFGVISFVKWICANWIIILSIIVGLVVIAGISTIVVLTVKKKRSRKNEE